MKIGDVFRGKPSFTFGRSRSLSDDVYVEGESVIQVSDSYKETYKVNTTVRYNSKTGEAIRKDTKKFAHDDKTRPAAEFVVEQVRMTGGDAREMIRDEPHVTARRLNRDGSYNPTGELITFVYCPEGSRSNFNTAVNVEPHRAMTRVVNFV